MDLFAVHVMYYDRGWYLEQNYISPAMSKQLRDKVCIIQDGKTAQRWVPNSALHIKSLYILTMS